MKSVLVVDYNKISILMTVEACKDVIQKAKVKVAYTGKEALEKIKEENFDLIIVDFDLPDCDGISLIKELKKEHAMPMFLTAFPDSLVLGALQKDLYWYNDATRLIKKPVNFKELKMIIQSFVFEEENLVRLFKPEMKANLSREKKKSADVSAEILKMSIEGISVKYIKGATFMKNEKVVLRLSPSKSKSSKGAQTSFLVRGTIFFIDTKKKVIELVFAKLSVASQKKLESLLKKSKVLEN